MFRSTALAVMLVGALLGAGCGGSGTPESGSSGSATPPASTPAAAPAAPVRTFPLSPKIEGQPNETRPPEKADDRPVFPGHVLVVPRRHLETLADLPGQLMVPLFATVQLAMAALERRRPEIHRGFFERRINPREPCLHRNQDEWKTKCDVRDDDRREAEIEGTEEIRIGARAVGHLSRLGGDVRCGTADRVCAWTRSPGH